MRCTWRVFLVASSDECKRELLWAASRETTSWDGERPTVDHIFQPGDHRRALNTGEAAFLHRYETLFAGNLVYNLTQDPISHFPHFPSFR
eukprot:4911085-Pyramimonas_sp.AAC.1